VIENTYGLNGTPTDRTQACLLPRTLDIARNYYGFATGTAADDALDTGTLASPPSFPLLNGSGAAMDSLDLDPFPLVFMAYPQPGTATQINFSRLDAAFDVTGVNFSVYDRLEVEVEAAGGFSGISSGQCQTTLQTAVAGNGARLAIWDPGGASWTNHVDSGSNSTANDLNPLSVTVSSNIDDLATAASGTGIASSDRFIFATVRSIPGVQNPDGSRCTALSLRRLSATLHFP
jgi:hypothetical protein